MVILWVNFQVWSPPSRKNVFDPVWEPVKTATLQNGHNQNGHTEWNHYQNGHTTLVKTATLLWSKRPHRMRSYQNGHAFFGQNGHTLFVKTATRWALPKWAEVATKTATLHLVKTATNSEWYQFCEEWIPECVCVTPQNVHNFIVLNKFSSVSEFKNVHNPTEKLNYGVPKGTKPLNYGYP